MYPLNPKSKRNCFRGKPEDLSQVSLKSVPVSCFRFRKMERPIGLQEQGVSFNTGIDLLRSKADRDCSHEIKRRLLLGRKAMTNLDSILKSRDIALPTKEKFMSAIVCIRRQWNSIFIVLRESIFELGFLCPNYFYGILHRHNNPNSPPLRQTKIRLLLERKQIGSIL